MSEKTPILDSIYFGTSVDHYNQESGSWALSLAEQIGRTAALLETVETEEAAAPLRRTLDRLESMLEAELARRQGVTKPAPRPTPLRTV